MSSEHSFTGTTKGCLDFASSRSSTFAHTCPPKEQKNQAEHSDVMVLAERAA